jgi:hypothetical protein
MGFGLALIFRPLMDRYFSCDNASIPEREIVLSDNDDVVIEILDGINKRCDPDTLFFALINKSLVALILS